MHPQPLCTHDSLYSQTPVRSQPLCANNPPVHLQPPYPHDPCALTATCAPTAPVLEPCGFTPIALILSRACAPVHPSTCNLQARDREASGKLTSAEFGQAMNALKVKVGMTADGSGCARAYTEFHAARGVEQAVHAQCVARGVEQAVHAQCVT